MKVCKYSSKKLIFIKSTIMKSGKTYKTSRIGKMNKIIDFHMPVLRKTYQNTIDSGLIRENKGQRKSVFWHILRIVGIIGCKGMPYQKYFS